jgi:hypothetical protein
MLGGGSYGIFTFRGPHSVEMFCLSLDRPAGVFPQAGDEFSDLEQAVYQEMVVDVGSTLLREFGWLD